MDSVDFSFRYDWFSRVLLGLLGAGPRWSRVVVRSDDIVVRMGVFFSAVIPLSQVLGAKQVKRWTLNRGVHGLGGRWLVNGAGQGLVEITIDPRVRASVMGFGVRLRALTVSVEDPDGLVRALC
jgi:hypothetical protein